MLIEHGPHSLLMSPALTLWFQSNPHPLLVPLTTKENTKLLVKNYETSLRFIPYMIENAFTLVLALR
jgi:hypothetical protein